MTNSEIIGSELQKLELDPLTTIVDTYPGWKRRGFQVKKGEKALFKTKIWKPCKIKSKDKDDSNTDNKENMILVLASFFLDSQVEKALSKS